MDVFWKLLRESVLVSSMLALSLVITACYLWIRVEPVPQELYMSLGIVLGYFFGAKSQKAAQQEG